MWGKSALIGRFLFYKYRSMTAADTVKMNKQNAIATEANKQFGIYEELIEVNKNFIKQLKENAKKSDDGKGKPVTTQDTLKLICGNIISQTVILKQMLDHIKNISTNGIKSAMSPADGQQKEMAEAVKKNNQVKGAVNGELKIAPQSVKELATSTSAANTKAMEASNKKQALALRTQKLAQSYTTAYKKGGKVAVATKAGGDLFKTLVKILPKLLVGLKKILMTVLNPATMIAMFIARFLPYVILGIAFLYGVWLGIKDRIGELIAEIPGLLWKGIVGIFDLWWTGMKYIGQGVWWCIDKIGDGIAWCLFKVWEGFGEWWDQLKEVVSFGIDWVKDLFSGIGDWFVNLGSQIKEIVTFCVDWVVQKATAIKDKVVGIVTGIKDKVVGIFTSVKDKIVGFFGGIKDKFTGFFGGIKKTLANSWLGRKLGFGDDSGASDSTVNNTNNTTNVTNNNDSAEDVIKGMTKNITAPMNQMTKLVENQGKLLKNLNMTPISTNANFSSGMTPVNGEIIVTPNDNITSTLIQQNNTISTMQANNNKEIAMAFNRGIDKLVNTMNANYQDSRMASQQAVTVEG